MFFQKEVFSARKQVYISKRVLGVERLLQVLDRVPDLRHMNEVFAPDRLENVRFHQVHKGKHLHGTIRRINERLKDA